MVECRARRRWRAIGCVAVFLVTVHAFAGSAAWPVPSTPAADWFDRYAAGDFNSVVESLTASPAPEKVIRAIKDEADAWVARASGDAAHRRLVAAAVGLEAAQVLRGEWPARRDLIEWGCRLLRQTNPPLPAERPWQLAAVALAEWHGEGLFLRTPPQYAANWGPSANHLAHAEARFPDEPRFKLADAILELGQGGILDVPVEPSSYAPYKFRVQERESGPELVPSADAAPSAARTIREAWALHIANGLRDLGLLMQLSDPSVRSEAHVRFGVIELELGQPSEALIHFDAGQPLATEPFLAYLIQLFRAAAFVRLGRSADAEGAYRAALALVPHAESAVTGLALLLSRTSRPAEASALVDQSLRSPSAVVDPLTMFYLGDARLYSTFITQLRASLR